MSNPIMNGATAPIVEIRHNGDPSGRWRRLLTHIEIRRAQNGFIVSGFNASWKLGDQHYMTESMPLNRVVYVCETVESLCATIASLSTEAGDFAWSPSVDIPITDLYKTYPESK